MIHTLIISLIATCLLCLTPVSVTADDKAGGGKTVTIAVDCAKGDSINKALREKAEELIIEISGICEEDVQVRRSNVTLRGTDPLVDGIQAAPGELLDQALNLFGVFNVVIENLKLSGGRVGLGINYTFSVDIINCRVEGNEAVGVIVGSGSGSIDLVDTLVSANSNIGILVTNGSSLRCSGCIVDNHTTGVRVITGSELGLGGSTVQGVRAIDVRGGSRVFRLFGSSASTIEGSFRALLMRDNASADLGDETLVGTLEMQQKSVATLQDTTQTAASGLNRVLSGSSLVARGATSLAGNILITEFSEAAFPIGTTVAGNLTCSLGGAAACDDPVGTVGGTSDCGQCFK